MSTLPPTKVNEDACDHQWLRAIDEAKYYECNRCGAIHPDRRRNAKKEIEHAVSR